MWDSMQLLYEVPVSSSSYVRRHIGTIAQVDERNQLSATSAKKKEIARKRKEDHKHSLI